MKSIYGLSAVFIFAGVLQAQSMHGTVTDAVTKNAISGATVTLVEIAKTYTTDSAGQFATGNVGAGTYTVRVTAPRYLTFSKRAIIASALQAGISDLEFNAALYNFSSAADTSQGVMTINYQFPGHGEVEFVIKNSTGTKVRKMYDRSRVGGMRAASWNGRDDEGNYVPAGRYTCQVSSGRLVMVRTLIWKGATEEKPATVVPPPAPSKTAPPAVPAKTEAPAPASPVQSPQTPAVTPPSPPPDTTVPVEEIPETPEE